MDVYFATNRNSKRIQAPIEFGERFNKDGPQFYRVGRATVEKISDDPDEGFIVKEVSLAAESKTGAPVKLGSKEIFGALQQKMMSDNRDAIVFIHGFANSFESALCRAAQLGHAYKVTRADGETYSPHVFAFTWPSNGEVVPPWQYFSDRDDAEASGKAMARALIRLVEFLDETRSRELHCNQRLHLVAHSMGNWALRHMVQGLRTLTEDSFLRPVFDNVFLMAADEDDDTLEPHNEHKLGLLPKMARQIHVYHSSDDGALVISDKTKFNPDRLGYNGPRSFSGLNTRITGIDCQLVDKTQVTHINHQYYRLSPEVIRDVCAVMSGNERVERLPWREVVEPGRRFRIRVA